jgi:hypothetical protein
LGKTATHRAQTRVCAFHLTSIGSFTLYHKFLVMKKTLSTAIAILFLVSTGILLPAGWWLLSKSRVKNQQ